MLPVWQTARAAKTPLDVTGIGGPCPRYFFRIEGDIVGDEKIQPAVPIVVQKRTASAEPRMRIPQSGFFGDVRKGAVAVVAIQDVLAPTGDEEIFKPVVVVVSNCHAVLISGAEQARAFGNVGEGSVAVVLVETLGGIRRRIAETGTGKHENVDPAVIVVVEEGRPATHGLCHVVGVPGMSAHRSEEHTSELQSPCNLVCRLLLEKK